MKDKELAKAFYETVSKAGLVRDIHCDALFAFGGATKHEDGDWYCLTKDERKWWRSLAREVEININVALLEKAIDADLKDKADDELDTGIRGWL